MNLEPEIVILLQSYEYVCNKHWLRKSLNYTNLIKYALPILYSGRNSRAVK